MSGFLPSDTIARFKFRAAPLLLVSATILWAVLIRWNAPLTELHDFRQSQTALSAYWMTRDGIALLYPPLPVFGVEHISVPLEFPLYQAITALLAKSFGLPLIAATLLAGRMVGFVFFLSAGYAFYRLVRYLHDETLAAIALGFYLFMPFVVSWGATVGIEYLALTCALLWLEAICRLAIGRSTDWRLLAWALMAGSLVMLVKITTALVYGPVMLALWIYWAMRSPTRPTTAWLVVATLCAGLVPFAVGYWWVEWSDQIKAQSPLTLFLTSRGSSDWTFGTLASRLDLHDWAKVGFFWISQIYALVGVTLAIVGSWVWWRSNRQLLFFWIVPPVTGAIVFFNLYWHHDYYHIAILPGLLVPMAAGFRVFMGPSATRNRLVAGAALVVLVAWFAIAAQTLIPNYETPVAMLSEFRLGPTEPSLRRKRDLFIVDMLREHTKPEDVAMIAVGDWPSVIPFLAERRVLMAQHCGTDLKTHPHLDYFVIDDQRSGCADIAIPPRCRIASRDGMALGTCLLTDGR